MKMRNVRIETQISDARGSIAYMLPAVCCILFLACAAPPGTQHPIRTQAAPPPAISQEETLASNEGTRAVTAEQGRPRVMVVVKRIPKDDIIAVTDRMLEPETLESLIADAFQSRGFPVVNAAAARENLKKDQLRRILEGDDRAAVEVGLGAEADVVVGGTVQESSERRAATNAAETTDIVKVRLAARAVNTATGVVLGSTLVELEGPLREDIARQLAADSAGSELAARILAAWKGRTTITEIYAENADYQRVQLLKSTIIQETRGVDSVVTTSLVGRSAVVEVFSELPSDELLAQINRCTTAIPFSIKTFSGNRIDIRFLDAPQKCEPELK
jgi:uncharacterized lipoprotein YajG